MKTFKDLKFETDANMPNHIRAKLTFSNGCGISVIQGDAFGCPSPGDYYEFIGMYNGKIFTESTPSVGTEADITSYMKTLQKNRKKTPF